MGYLSRSGIWDLSFQRLYLRLERSLDPWCFADASVLMGMMIEK